MNNGNSNQNPNQGNNGPFPNYAYTSSDPMADAAARQAQQRPPQTPKRKIGKGWKIAGGITAGFFALIITAGIAGGSGSANDAAKQASQGVVHPTATPSSSTPAPATKPTRQAHTPAPKPTKTTPPAPKVTEPALTAGQEQAIGAAEDYLEFKAFSRKGLIDQLSSEYGDGFSKADATYAVDHIIVDWNEQAALSAKAYLQLKHSSRNGLIQQLESEYGEQFTHAQAVYGVKKAGL